MDEKIENVVEAKTRLLRLPRSTNLRTILPAILINLDLATNRMRRKSESLRRLTSSLFFTHLPLFERRSLGTNVTIP